MEPTMSLGAGKLSGSRGQSPGEASQGSCLNPELNTVTSITASAARLCRACNTGTFLHVPSRRGGPDGEAYGAYYKGKED